MRALNPDRIFTIKMLGLKHLLNVEIYVFTKLYLAT